MNALVKNTYLLLCYAWNLGDLNLWLKKKIIIVIMVEIQSCNLGLDPGPTYGLTKAIGKFEQACLGIRRRLADLDLNLI